MFERVFDNRPAWERFAKVGRACRVLPTTLAWRILRHFSRLFAQSEMTPAAMWLNPEGSAACMRQTENLTALLCLPSAAHTEGSVFVLVVAVTMFPTENML